MEILKLIEENITPSIKLTDISRVLYDSYDTFMFDFKAWELISAVLPDKVVQLIDEFKDNIIGHEIINDIVMKYYPGEKVIKYQMVRDRGFIEDEITAFEMVTGKSRLDVARVNGKSYAYEIKTELDTLNKLEKQIADYSKVFEYVDVVLHAKHLEKAITIIPEHCGIIVYDINNGQCNFEQVKKPHKSPLISLSSQVKSMNSKEMALALKKAGLSNVPNNKAEREKKLISIDDEGTMNDIFKFTIKERYKEQWLYVNQIMNDILPIDMQVFFHSKADPRWVYYKNSSIV